MANLTWQIGAVKVTRIVEMESVRPGGGPESTLPESWPHEVREHGWLIPDFADEDGNLRLSVHALLLETPSLRLIVDTCTGDGKVRTAPRFNMLSTGFLQRLEDAGCRREEMNGVICTHLHIDHVGWNTMKVDERWVPTFPHARYYFGRTEWEHWCAEVGMDPATRSCTPEQAAVLDPDPVYADSIAPIVDAGLASFVDTNAQICPEVRLIPTPGHTPGHVSVMIESQGRSAVITGDMMHHPCQIARPQWPSAFDTDRAQALATRLAFMKEFADSGTLIIGTHFGGPAAGLLTRHEDHYRLAAFPRA